MDNSSNSNKMQAVVAVITMAVAAVSTAFNLLNIYPQIDWRIVALVAQVVFAVLVWWRIYNLNQLIASKTPHVILNKAFVTDSSIYSEMPIYLSADLERTKRMPTNFAHVELANKPPYPTEQNHANNLVAKLTYYDVGGNKLLGPIYGRWSSSDAPKTPNDLPNLLRRQIRSDGVGENLDIVSKPKASSVWYAFNNQNYFFNGMVSDSFKLDSSVVDVHVELVGERVRKDFWIRIFNEGINGSIRIEPRQSWLRRSFSRQ